MNEEVVKLQLETHDKRLNNHAERLDKLEQDGREFRTEIKNLCENIKSLTSAIKWLIGLGASSLLGFFFYAIQSGLFKK